MAISLRQWMLPRAQRRTLAELDQELDLRAGDGAPKKSAFWTMLSLSAVIASAGVLMDSTATVIGAMIIAPLSTPIMGLALAVVKREPNGSLRYVLAGSGLVIAVGLVFSFILPGSYDLSGNSQISSRTSPGMLDLVAAMATGLAGAVALARRDVAAVLPGVAIAISLVPPLAVAGVCLGHGAISLAIGASLLFLSNLLSLALSGMFVFAVLGYAAAARPASEHRLGRAYVTLAVLLAMILVPLSGNTVAAVALLTWTTRVQAAATQWISVVPGAAVTDVQFQAGSFHVMVRTPGEVPPVDDLTGQLSGRVPFGFGVVVETTTGRELDAGYIGAESR